LFDKYPDAAALAAGNREDIEQCIASLGLYRNKARSIQGFAQAVTERFDGEIPQTMEELVSMPGVGRKCANVILSECYGIPALAVDTHVARISKRLGLAYQKDTVDAIEKKLKRKVPKERWIKTHHQMIFFGRYLCHARNPECFRCPFTEICHEKNKNLDS
jgi:endonuclease-3